jgi:carbonic anhydrase/acetyltransferase-like protein (isoleucine patch superfamily)
MNEDIRDILTGLLKESQLVAAVQAWKQGKKKSFLFGDQVRSLTAQEIELLKSRGNQAEDWANIRVKEGFKPDFISNNTFSGECVLGLFSGAEKQVDDGAVLASGIYNSTIINCQIGDDCLVENNGLISGYLIKDQAVVVNNGSISAGKNCPFGNGIQISLGIETGGREVLSFAELTIPIAEQVATRRNDKNLLEFYRDFAGKYREALSFDYGIIESGSLVRNSTRIADAYLGEYVLIDGACLIQNCTILSSQEERTEVSHGAFVKNSCLQWGCEVTSMAIVVDSVLTEHSHVERHAKVTASIIGPNTGIAEGEVTASLVGPFVGFHHQALLIAAIWPEGKGNIAYGANVGSNHTSRAPDQEIFCGEGVFFGLGTNIKFPADFRDAPYLIIATGVDTLPQKVEYPFSLIHSASEHYEGVPAPYNEIIPAWVLSDNVYAVRRNEGKYKKRNKARRTVFEFDVFRPDIVDKMAAARDRLRDVKVKKQVYTEGDIRGVGKNYLLEKRRGQAVEAYNFYLEYYCLCGLKERVAALLKAGKKAEVASVYESKTTERVWEHQRALLNKEAFSGRGIKENLERLGEIIEKIAEETYRAKQKDDIRGAKVIRDYKETYTQAENDSFIVATRQETAATKGEIKKIISDLK